MLTSRAATRGSMRKTFSLPSRKLAWLLAAILPDRRRMSGAVGAPLTRSTAVAVKNYTCPIPGCHHVFRGSRGGWDAHVASLRKHPDWQPDVTHGGKRKRLFKKEHPEW